MAVTAWTTFRSGSSARSSSTSTPSTGPCSRCTSGWSGWACTPGLPRSRSSSGWCRWPRARSSCYGLTEPNAGSDVASMQSTARRHGDGYVLNGQKVWVSDADTADFLLVFAKTDTEAGHRGVSAFMLDREACGKALRTEPIHDRLGIRAGDVGS